MVHPCLDRAGVNFFIDLTSTNFDDILRVRLTPLVGG